MSRDKTLAGLRLLEQKNQQIRDLKAALTQSEVELGVALREVASLQTKPVPVRKPARVAVTGKESSFILGLTDNHLTQVVDPELGSGNSHNEEIAKRRMFSVIRQADKIIRNAVKSNGVGEVLLWLGGDSMVNSDLHPHFRRITPYEPQEELAVVEGIFLALFEEILEKYNWGVSLRVHGSLSNHGRDAKKEDVSAEIAYRRSYDATLYHHLSRMIDVPFHIEKSYFGVEEVGGVKACLHHGHRLTMRDDPVTGLCLPNWTHIRKRISQPRHAGTTLWMQGHYHTAVEIVSQDFTFVSAGSTVGQDGFSYDLNYSRHKPSQPLVEIRDGYVHAVHRLECE